MGSTYVVDNLVRSKDAFHQQNTELFELFFDMIVKQRMYYYMICMHFIHKLKAIGSRNLPAEWCVGKLSWHLLETNPLSKEMQVHVEDYQNGQVQDR